MYVSAALATSGLFGRFGGGIDAFAMAVWMLPPRRHALGAVVGARTTWARRAASLVLWADALPLGVLWLRVTAPEFADALHAIKTGAAIPWLVVALGLPFLARGR
ncbi:MAG: hypothetical protein IPN17_24465 [Deltaproteobacteria bacterium]|nr:hypothetical protein [Deltaproteobacteria bacterium]